MTELEKIATARVKQLEAKYNSLLKHEKKDTKTPKFIKEAREDFLVGLLRLNKSILRSDKE